MPNDLLRAGLWDIKPTREIGIDVGHVQRQHVSLLRRQFVTATRAQKASSAARSTDLLLEEEPLQTRLPGTVVRL